VRAVSTQIEAGGVAARWHEAHSSQESGGSRKLLADVARLRWPLPALLAWTLAWAVFGTLKALAAPPAVALAAAALLGAVLAPLAATNWRRAFVAIGFPLSLVASGAAGTVPPWAWLLPLGVLVAIYPLRAWRDAPLFPTPAGALEGLAAQAPLGAGSRILDAGCGLGDGLAALRREYPLAVLDGLEWSWPLAIAAACRRRDARIRRGDLWAADWSTCDLVYLFQRPESMARAAAKAARELAPGAWLVSLEFEAPELVPQRVLNAGGVKPVWLYRAPFTRR